MACATCVWSVLWEVFNPLLSGNIIT